jgi:hypothetical protein
MFSLKYAAFKGILMPKKVNADALHELPPPVDVYRERML